MSRQLPLIFCRYAVVMVATLVALVGCSSSSQTDPDPTQADEYFKATVDGKSWSCSPEASVVGGTAFATVLTGTFGSPQDSSFHSIIISVPAQNSKVGRYKIDSLTSENVGGVQYTENNKYGFSAAKQEDGYFEITSVSATHVEGKFSFNLIGSNMETGEVLRRTFTGGTFRLQRL